MTRSYVSSSVSVMVAFVAFVVVESGFAVMVGQLPQGVAVDICQGTSVLQPRPGRGPRYCAFPSSWMSLLAYSA